MIEKESTQPRTRGRQRTVKTSSKTATSLIEGSPPGPEQIQYRHPKESTHLRCSQGDVKETIYPSTFND